MKLYFEGYEGSSDDILRTAKQNGYFTDAVNNIESKLEQNQSGEWCYPRYHHSGRDYYKLIPLENITDSEQEELLTSIIQDDLILSDYDWGNMSVDEIESELWDNSEPLFYEICDYLNQ